MSYCSWALHDELLNKAYHNTEWGVPLKDVQKQFEFLSLEVMQCGLSWTLVLKKRAVLQACFDNFDYEKIASYTEADVERIISAEGMIRSAAKIRAIIGNARQFIKIRSEFGSFSNYLWRYSGGKTILYNKHSEGYIPASNGLSDTISRDLKKRGFKYLGSVTVYSHLQACGIINDHGQNCPRYHEINENYPTVTKRRYKERNINKFD